MVTMLNSGAYVLNGTEIIADDKDAAAVLGSKLGNVPAKEEAKKGTIAYGILESNNVSGNMEKLQIKFDKLTSHDITFVGIIQTARASGMLQLPVLSKLYLSGILCPEVQVQEMRQSGERVYGA